MGQKILLINPMKPPSKRRKPAKATKGAKMAARKPARKRRSAAQIAATRRLVALNKTRRRVRRRKNPITPSKAAAAPYRAVPRMANPLFRRKRRAVAGRVRRRKNPINSALEILQRSAVGAAWGAGGAVAVDVAMGILPVPAAMKTGYLKFVTKGLLSGLLGAAAGYVVDRRAATAMGAGALTVALHGALSKFVTENVPGVTLGYYNASLPATTANLGAYVSGDIASQGEYGAGMGAYVSGTRGAGSQMGRYAGNSGSQLRAVR